MNLGMLSNASGMCDRLSDTFKKDIKTTYIQLYMALKKYALNVIRP